MIKAFDKRKCLIILGFQGFRVHGGGEKDLTSLSTITTQKGEGRKWRKGEREREKKHWSLQDQFWNLKASDTPSDTPHPTTLSLLILFKQFHQLGTKHSNEWAWVGEMAQLRKARFTSQYMSLWGPFSYEPVIWITSFLLSFPSHS